MYHRDDIADDRSSSAFLSSARLIWFQKRSAKAYVYKVGAFIQSFRKYVKVTDFFSNCLKSTYVFKDQNEMSDRKHTNTGRNTLTSTVLGKTKSMHDFL